MCERVRKLLFAALVLPLAAFMAIPVAAQTAISGDVTGTVTDPSGAVVPNAKIDLKNNATGGTQIQLKAQFSF
jgi:hypothetical protein